MIDKTIRTTAFNPGFGGGTLANFRGELIGVVSLNLNEVGKFSLAIPVDYYLNYERELKQFGQVQSRPRRPWLGLYPKRWPAMSSSAGLSPTARRQSSVCGRVILFYRWKNKRSVSRQALYQEMWKKRPGERISFRILRDEQSFDLEIVGGDRADRYRN
jgi:S1-C subfamily serine protease